MDTLVRKLVALGIPGLVLLIAISLSGLAGAAAITAALATLGGPAGMLGGIALLGVAGLAADGLAKYGLETLGAAVIQGLVAKGQSRESIWETVRRYPISKSYKRKVFSLLWPDRAPPRDLL